MSWNNTGHDITADLAAARQMLAESTYTPDRYQPLIVSLSVLDWARADFGNAVVDGWLRDGLIAVDR